MSSKELKEIIKKAAPLCLPSATKEEHIDMIVRYLVVNGVTVQEWISVKDRMPEEDGSYIIYIKPKCGGYPIKGCFAKNGGDYGEKIEGENVWFDYDREYGFYYISYVTHWMPLPKPPKGE